MLAFSIFFTSCQSPETDDRPPNIIYILADDLGYGDLGIYGQEKIKTPKIDGLAKAGMLFTQHYSGAPVCAPARSVLLTGRHSGHAQVRGNDEWADRGPVWDYHAAVRDSTLEGQRPMKEGTTTIATLLKAQGYATGIIGKWGLGAPHTKSTPNHLGFDYFFGYNCQRQAHTYYPLHLWENLQKVNLGNDTLAPHKKLPAELDPFDEASYSMFTLQNYSPEAMTAKVLDFVERNKKQPFFLYYASPLPHVPLQAPERWIEYYRNIFGDEEPYTGENGYFPNRHPKATYAAMISYLDEEVGLLIEKLKKEGLYENTLIIFSSDNGATYNGGTQSPWFQSNGIFKSEYGWGKGFLHEGGIRVPMIASWPGKIKAGSVTDHISAFQDVLPTLCEIAGTEMPSEADGLSFLNVLLEREQQTHEYLYWEFPESGGQQAVRMGKYKALRKDMHKGNLQWSLFDLEVDPQERHDIAEQYPEWTVWAEEIAQKARTPSHNPRWRYSVLGE
ncbi:MAG: arylsulfatase [Cyclobacteriaceae bacterium]|nr:arylsulfatase [Cyclobacteriaceae bacterium]